MAFGFWDAITFSTTMAVRDYYRDKEKRKRKQAEFYQKCYTEIGNTTSAMFEDIISIGEQAYPVYLPDEILKGISALPLYAYLKVLQAQGEAATTEQTTAINIIFKNLKFEFSKQEFLLAARIDNKAKQQLNELVGISEHFAGKFWVVLFKAMYKTDSDEKTLTKVIDSFSNIVMRFAILGKPESEVALPICENFIGSIHKQIVECRSIPEERIDFMGEISFAEHYNRMKKIILDLDEAVGGHDDVDMEQALQLFTVGILYKVLNHSNRNVFAQTEMLAFIMDEIEINLGLDAQELMDEFQHGGDVQRFVDRLCELPKPGAISLWNIVISMGDEASLEDMAMDFFTECTGFMIGVESVLTQKYRNSDFGRFSHGFMREVVGNLRHLFE